MGGGVGPFAHQRWVRRRDAAVSQRRTDIRGSAQVDSRIGVIVGLYTAKVLVWVELIR